MDRTATCSCGQLSVTIRGDPFAHGICSCIECQKMSGSAFSYSGYWQKAAIQRIDGESTVWRRVSDAGRWNDNHFCPACGSVVFAYVEFDENAINICIGNFADPSFPPPVYAAWNKFKHAWFEIPPGCEVADTQ